MIHLIRNKRTKRNQRGQSIAEVMVSLPFMLLVVVGLVEMGIVFASYLSLVNAAREGAIFASMCPKIQDPSNDSSTLCTNGGSTTNIQEYQNRVALDMTYAVGSALITGQLQNATPDCNDDPSVFWGYHECLQVDRPVIGPPAASVDCPIGNEVGCPITVTVHYRIHTFTSGISLPYLGRLGLPDYYPINYSMAIPIR